MRRACLVLFSLSLLLLLAAPAAEAQPRPRDCGDRRTQMEMTACAAEEHRDADAQLNQVYGRLRARLVDARRRGELLTAQRAWLRFRDAHCALEASAHAGGSLEPYTRALCRAALTRERTRGLRELLRREELER